MSPLIVFAAGAALLYLVTRPTKNVVKKVTPVIEKTPTPTVEPIVILKHHDMPQRDKHGRFVKRG